MPPSNDEMNLGRPLKIVILMLAWVAAGAGVLLATLLGLFAYASHRAVEQVSRFCEATQIGSSKDEFVRRAKQAEYGVVDDAYAGDGQVSAMEHVIFLTVGCTAKVRAQHITEKNTWSVD